MTDVQFAMYVAAVVVLCVVSFVLGYGAAENRERRAKKILDANLKWEVKQRKLLINWIRENWPSEEAAFKQGHFEGYQQGYEHGSSGDCE